MQHSALEHLPAKVYPAVKAGYSNIKKEALSILHSLETFHQYCLTCEVSAITDQKPLVSIFKKDFTTLSTLECILLFIHQYKYAISTSVAKCLHISQLSRQNYCDNKDKRFLAGI